MKLLNYLFVSILLFTTIAPAFAKNYHSTLPPHIRTGMLDRSIIILNKMKKGDRLYITTDSLGGSVQELGRYLIARVTTKGKTTCIVNYEADSAAAIITHVCHKILIYRKAYVLFHMPRYTKSEKIGDKIVKRTIIIKKGDKKHAVAYLRAVYFLKKLGVNKVLTKQEWEAMLNGHDIVVHADELKNRLPNKVKVF